MSEGVKLIFVVGVGRSGTSLIQSMLSSHPEISFIPETSLLRRLILPGKLDAAARADGAEGAVAGLREDPRVDRLGQDIASVMQAAGPSRGDGLGLRFFRQLIEDLAERDGAAVVGEKDPRLVEYLPVLFAAWPHAYVLHIVRDPRDVLASRQRAGWSRGRATWTEVLAYRTQLRAGRRDGRRFGARYIEIRYEALLESPETVLDGICNRLGLRYDPEMLDFTDAARTLVAASETEWQKNTLKPLMSDNMGKWEGRLTPFQATLCERTCGRAFTDPVASTGRAGGRWAGTRNAPFTVRVAGAAMAVVVRIAEVAYRLVRAWRVAGAVRRVRRSNP